MIIKSKTDGIQVELQAWERRLLGFSTPWWFLALLWVPGPLQHARSMLGLLGFTVGSVLALFKLADSEPGVVSTVALWFVLGVVSVPVALVLFLMAGAMAGLVTHGP